MTLFLLSTLLVGPLLLVNIILKDHWGRPRPNAVDLFGGDSPYVAVWRITNYCDTNCSFVSGETATAFWLMALALVVPRASALPAAIVTAVYAAILSANRIAFGGHFLSDVLISVGLTLLVVVIGYRLFITHPPRMAGQRTAGSRADPARPRTWPAGTEQGGAALTGMREPEPDLFGEAESAVAEPHSLAEARRLARICTRCDLYRNATQTVFGEGPVDARIMLVGEQPGDQEDLQGRPFVGPAGQVLDRGLADAGLDRAALYITNGVKHFKNEPRGKRRLHKRPDIAEIDICRWWLDLERKFVRPAVIVALGATGLRSVTGRSLTIASTRGKPTPLHDGATLIVTVHPSYLLRLPDRDAAEREYHRFVADLRLAAES